MTVDTFERADVEQLFAAELQLSQRAMDLTAELETAEAAAGEATLQAALGTKGDGKAVSRVAAIRAEIDATEHAIVAARTRRAAAIPSVFRAEAAVVREQAAPLQAEIDERQARTDELLAALYEHEGVVFVPDRPDSELVRTQVRNGATVTFAVPKTDGLRAEVATIEHQAQQIDARGVERSGHLTASSRDDLMARLCAWDPLKIAPELSAALTWFDQAARAEQSRRVSSPSSMHGLLAPDAPVVAELVWRDGVIDPTRSRVVLPTPGTIDEDAYRIATGQPTEPAWHPAIAAAD